MSSFLTNEVKWVEGMKWPPQCCVPAFLNAALRDQSYGFSAPQALPAILGVNVLPDDYNPLGLTVTKCVTDAGVTPYQTKLKINKFLDEQEIPLHFFHVELSEIVFGLHDEFLQSALNQNASIGVGLDYGKLVGEERKTIGKHVLRIVSQSQKNVSLVDDSFEAETPRQDTSLERIIDAMRSINGGYWILGPKGIKIRHFNSMSEA